MSQKKDELYATFGDSCLYESDYDILKRETEWLNDAIISFYIEHLSEKESMKANKEHVLFTSPSAMFMVPYTDSKETLDELLRPLKMKEKQVIFIPVNNNSNIQAVGGGSHWSLMVFVKKLNRFLYFDSMGTLNYYSSLTMASSLHQILNTESTKVSMKVRVCQTPQQNNGYDCGWYCLAIIELLSNLIINQQVVDGLILNDPNVVTPLLLTINQDFIKSKKTEVRNLVESIHNQKK
eukprot:gene2062-2542_t